VIARALWRWGCAPLMGTCERRRRANDCPGSRAVFTLVMLPLASLTPRYYVPTTETTRSATTSCNSASSR
jgi:hypothetical protein